MFIYTLKEQIQWNRSKQKLCITYKLLNLFYTLGRSCNFVLKSGLKNLIWKVVTNVSCNLTLSYKLAFNFKLIVSLISNDFPDFYLAIKPFLQSDQIESSLIKLDKVLLLIKWVLAASWHEFEHIMKEREKERERERERETKERERDAAKQSATLAFVTHTRTNWKAHI